MYIFVNSTRKTKLQQVLPASFAALLNQRLDFLGTCAGGDHERIGGIDNDDVVDSENGDEAAGDGDDDSSSGLLGDD